MWGLLSDKAALVQASLYQFVLVDQYKLRLWQGESVTKQKNMKNHHPLKLSRLDIGYLVRYYG